MLTKIIWYLSLVAVTLVLLVIFRSPFFKSKFSDFTTVFRCCRWCMGLQPRIYGLDTYDDKQQYIFVINHQSFIDLFWVEPSSVIAKEVLRYFGPVGLIMHYCKMIFIRRSNHEKALEVMREAAELVKRDKINLFMFPEGTRCNTGRLMPFKKGAFHLAIQTQIPIQPIVISCYNKFLNHSERLYISGPITRSALETTLRTSHCILMQRVRPKSIEYEI
ncbi:unnamed protein product [Schistocephalus solidus]|uniref:1-acylglycerol-3-phosphate O-acyltransferase n=1 Tax=Schistocephalus solidus TaxID=70667 RepID=A0A183SB18_SCHSO|nr:unnamed protein product [Schistocephalus solidus]